jgi:hypothetical protein
MLEDMMENAISEPVKLKAATEILDRSGVRGGIEFDTNIKVIDDRPAAIIIQERLDRLAASAGERALELVQAGVVESDTSDIQDAEEVQEEEKD